MRLSVGHDGVRHRVFLSTFHASLRFLERTFAGVAAAMLLAIMLIGTLDVALRYLFNSPLGWSYDVISMYLMAGLFFFALSETLENHGHVAVDLLHSRMSSRRRHAAEIPGYGMTLVVLGAISILTASLTIESLLGGDVISGRFDWPTWVAQSFVTIGFSLMTLRVAYRFVGHVASALAGRDVIPLPPIAGRSD